MENDIITWCYSINFKQKIKEIAKRIKETSKEIAKRIKEFFKPEEEEEEEEGEEEEEEEYGGEPPKELTYEKLRIWLRNKMVDFEGSLETEIPKHIQNWWSIPTTDKNDIIYWLKEYQKTKDYQKAKMRSELDG